MSHWFLQCPFARAIWDRCFVLYSFRVSLPPSLWVFFNDLWGEVPLRRMSSLVFLLPGRIYWKLWKARCALFFNQQSLSPARVLRSIQILVAAVLSSLPSPKVVRPISVFWHLPVSPFVKLNVDGSSRVIRV